MEGLQAPVAYACAFPQDLRAQINSTGVFRFLELEDLLPEETRRDGIRLDPTKVTWTFTMGVHRRGCCSASSSNRYNIQARNPRSIR